MIEFKSIELNNFASFKQASLNYNNGLTLVSGENRDSQSAESNMAGKTSLIVEALLWCLYGQGTKEKSPEGTTVRGYTADDVIHRATDRCEVKVEMKVNGNDCTVVRSRKRRGSVKLSVTGLMTKDVKTMQQSLTDLLGIDYDAFVQAIVLGQGTKRFSQAKDNERKQILEQVLNLGIYSDALDRVRTAKKELRMAIAEGEGGLRSEESRLEVFEQSLEREKSRYQDVLQEQENWRTERDSELKDAKGSLKELRQGKAEAQKGLKELLKKNKDLQAQSGPSEDQLEEDKLRVSGELGLREAVRRSLVLECERLQQRVGVFSGDMESCPTCEQDVEARYIKGRLIDLNRDLKAAEERSGTANKDFRTSEGKLEKINDAIRNAYEIKSSLKVSKADVFRAKEDIKRIEEEIKETLQAIKEIENEEPPETVTPDDTEVKRAQREVKQAKTKIGVCKKQLAGFESEMEDLEFWDTGFGNKGIKSLVIDSVIPHLNRIANGYVNKVTDDVEIEFDTQTYTASGKPVEGLDLRIISDGGSGYHFGSGGERRRVDFAVSLALKSLLSSMGASSNLFILDEPFESVDAAGAEALVGLLKDYSMEQGIAVYCITHLVHMKPLFDGVVTVVREGGVSKLAS